MHTIAAKAVALGIAASEPFAERQRRTVANAKALAAGLMSTVASTSSPTAPKFTWSWST